MTLGYEPSQTREDLERRSMKSLERLGEEAQYCLAPFAPRKYGLITNIKVKEGYLTRVAWVAKKFLE